MSTLPLLVALFVAGGLGTLCRFGLNLLAQSLLSREFPFGTSLINAVGCLLFGLVMGLVSEKVIPQSYAPVVLIGFLGAFTTFSTFAYESHVLLQGSRWLELGLYLALQNVLGVLFVGVGMKLVQ